MKIRLLQDRVFAQRKGEILDVDPAEGSRLIACGQAVALADQVEAAIDQPAETAAVFSKRPPPRSPKPPSTAR